MSLKQLYKNLNIEPNTIEKEQEAFVNRSIVFLSRFLDKKLPYQEKGNFFIKYCFKLGINGEEIINRYAKHPSSLELVPSIFDVFEFSYTTIVRQRSVS